MKLKALPAKINFSAKCSDLFAATFSDENGYIVADYDGYVPGFFPGEHYGDYVNLIIDLKTGKILNWKAPSLKAINDALRSSEEEA